MPMLCFGTFVKAIGVQKSHCWNGQKGEQVSQLIDGPRRRRGVVARDHFRFSRWRGMSDQRAKLGQESFHKATEAVYQSRFCMVHTRQCNGNLVVEGLDTIASGNVYLAQTESGRPFFHDQQSNHRSAL